MNKEQLNEWGYPIHKESNYSKPPEGDFATWIGLIIVFTVMILADFEELSGGNLESL